MPCCCDETTESGCCKPMLLQVTRIFNGGRIRDSRTEIFSLTDFTPNTYTPPLSYIKASGEGIATIASQTVSRLNDGRSRIRIAYNFPVTVLMRDAADILVSANATLSRTLDVIMILPTKPYTFEAAYSYVSRIGEINGDGVTATVSGCLLTILKVLVKCEVVMKPCCCIRYPDAVLTEEVSCNAVFESDI